MLPIIQTDRKAAWVGAEELGRCKWGKGGKGYLGQNKCKDYCGGGNRTKGEQNFLVSKFTELLMLRLVLSRRGSLVHILGPKIPELSLRSFCSLSQSNYFIMGCKLFGERIELSIQTHKFCSTFYCWNEKKEIFLSGF